MRGEDIFGFMQGWMSGQAHVSDMKTAEAGRAQAMFALDQQRRDAPYESMSKRYGALDQQRLFNMNKAVDPWNTDAMVAKAKMLIDMYPKFTEKAGAQQKYDLTKLDADTSNVMRQNIRSLQDINTTEAKLGRGTRAVQGGDGSMYMLNPDGSRATEPMPPEMFVQWYMNPLGATNVAVDAANTADLTLLAAKQNGGYYAPPDVGMGSVPPVMAPEGERPGLNNRLGRPAAKSAPTDRKPAWEYNGGNRPLSPEEERAAFARSQASRTASAFAATPAGARLTANPTVDYAAYAAMNTASKKTLPDDPLARAYAMPRPY